MNVELLEHSLLYNYISCYTFSGHERGGTFGKILLARNTITQENVAIKKLLFQKTNGTFPIEELSEIKVLRKANHNNVIKLIEICKDTESNPFLSAFYLVFEFCEHKLSNIIANRNLLLNLEEIKNITQQLFSGLLYIHSNKIVHRDLRPSNILLNKSGILKLADFSLAVILNESDESSYSNTTVTVWYKPPEILLNEPHGFAVDMWSVGCILAEMWTRVPILQGSTNTEQMSLIIELCGSITSETWPGIEEIESFRNMNLQIDMPNLIKEKLQPYVADPLGLDLLQKLLVPFPGKRYSSLSALSHGFLSGDQMACSLSELLTTLDQF